MGWLMWCTYQLVCLLLFLLHSSSRANLCSRDQRSALLHFKQHFALYKDDSYASFCGSEGIISYPKMKYWEEDTDCCSWDGVTCDMVSGHVIGLDLKCSWLHGSIPSNSSLFLLSHLQKLNLAVNDFNLSPIPSDFYRLSSLTHLNLYFTNFSGQVPSEISHLSKLISLVLSSTWHGGVLTLETLAMKGFVQNMTGLERLVLDGVNMSTLALGYLTNLSSSLRRLSVADCELHGSSMGLLPASIGNLTQLSYLFLDDNRFSGHIPSSLSNLEQLVKLSLSGNNFSGEIPDIFANLTQLSYLDISSNSLSGPIPSHVSRLQNLAFISLDDNLLNGTIPSGFFSLPSLKVVDLSNNKLSGHIDKFQSNSLKEIYLTNNKLYGPIPSSIFKLVNLTHLWLFANHLSGTVELYMFAKFKNLQLLDLSYNSLSVSTKNKANSSFPRLSFLSLSACNVYEFPEILSTADSLRTLYLGDNKIHGHIPNWLFNISTLSVLSLSHNFLNCSLESLPAPPPLMKSFILSHNMLTGAIPLSFCNLSSIEYLDLSENSLYGTVPQSLVNSETISVLDLKKNNFHGNIPHLFANGSQLKTLNLNGNQLEGPVPPSLVNCGNLELLDIGNNKIDDVFPHWLATLPQLQVLILRSNRFHGPLGNSTTKFPFSKLRFLDLAHNGFTGPLQARFFENFEAMIRKNKSFVYMGDNYYKDSVIVTLKGVETLMGRISTIFTTMDLSGNKFGGQIPDVVGKLKSLKFLNLSHNNLIGNIPLSLENLTEFESLDFSSNRLEGKIPTQLTSLTFLSKLNLSYNKLVGPIPNGKQFDTFQNDSYIGNLGLCGLPLSKTCGDDEAPESEPAIFQEEPDAIHWFDWKFIMMGYASGLVIGLSMGYIAFSTGKPRWFVSMIERKVINLTGRRRRRN